MGQNFTKEEQAAGWPETLKHGQLAALQYPYAKGETVKIRLARARAGDIVDACKSGELPHTSTIAPAKAVNNGRINLAGLRGRFSANESTGWGGLSGLPTPTRNAYGERVYETEGERRDRLWKEANPPKQPDRIDHCVSAPAFAAWLSAQGEAPSAHIAAWFDAMGIDTDPRPIVPPESWAVQSPHGLQRCDGTADGRLVRLAEVVAWQIQARELPCQNAVELVCKALQRMPAAGSALYVLSDNGYANELEATHSFFYVPIMVVGKDYPEGTPEDKGLVGALKYMRSFWGESSAPGAGNWCGQEVLDPLAVRLSLAHRLWGYGRRGDEVVPGAATIVAMPATAVPVAKPMQRSAAQDAAVLAALKAMVIDPLAVPKNEAGKAGTKAEVRAALASNALFTGKTVFDKTWERLSTRGEIVIST